MIKNLIIVLIVLFSACTLFKRSSKTTDQSFSNSSNKMDLYASSAIDKKTNSRKYTFRRDSASADYTIRLWPRGTASFSSNGSFTGEFDSVQVEGRHQKVHSSAKLQHNSEEMKRKAAVNVQQIEESKTGSKRVEKVKSPQKFLLIFLVVFVFLAIFITTKGCILTRMKGVIRNFIS